MTLGGEGQVELGAAREPHGDAELPRLTSEDFARSSLIEQFDRVVALRPDAIAVIAGRERLSFLELQSWSSQIASELHDRLGDGSRPVATLLGHTPTALAAMLGIARAGRPFMNLDPTLPDLRLEQMLQLGEPEACLVDDLSSETVARLRVEALPIRAVAAPRGPATATQRVVRRPSSGIACLLFTSGSTGRPKGIVWPHATLMKDALAGQQAMRFTECDRIGLVMPIEFVAGLIVATWGLTSGAALCMFDPRRQPISELTDWMAREHLTTLHATPTLLRAVVRAMVPDQRFPDLRLVTTCGEPVTAADVRSVRSHVSDTCEFMNWTGSSEVGVLALHRVAPGDPLGEGPLPAGLVVEGVSVEIEPLDDDAESAAGVRDITSRGDFGELIVASAHIALGYCGDTGELASRFSAAGNTRRYRSGDLATLGPTGELRLHGRRDAAVKINGYLVEPSEAEAVLLEAPEVADAHVAVERPDGTPRLVAYVVPALGHVLSVSRLRGYLRERLPLYMVPTTIVQVPELPRTDRGKIDHITLRASHAHTLRPEVRAPATDLEFYIAQIWRNVLGLREVGVDDDFFELGGDSLAVEEVLAELQKLGPDLPSAAFISTPTVAGLAAAVEHASYPRLRGGVVEMRRSENGPTLLCFAGAGGIALAFERLVRNLELDLDLQVYGVQMHALEYRGLPDYTVARAAARVLRTLPRLRPRGPYVLVGHSYGGLVALEVARHLRSVGHEVSLLALVDAFPPNPPPESSGGRTRGPAGRMVAEAARVWSALPGGGVLGRLIALPRMLTAGPIRYRGIKHYGAFFNRGWLMQQLYRAEPYAGRAVVYVGERNLNESEQLRWAHVLIGPWETASVPGDHHTVLREPYVQSLAADLCGRIVGTSSGEA